MSRSVPSATSVLPAARLALWQEQFRRRDLQACERLARDGTVAFPQAGKAWQLLGATLLAQGRAAEAVPVLQQASALVAGDWSVWDNLGVALQRGGDFSGAAAAFATSRRLAPLQAGTWSNASVNELEAGNSEAALELAREAVRLAPGAATAHLIAGNALSALGRRADAEAAFRQALALQPDQPQALLSLGRELGDQGRVAEAITTTRRALEVVPGYADAHVNLANYLNTFGDIDAAARHYTRALELDPRLVAAGSGALYCMLHDERYTPAEIAAAHRELGERIEAPWRAGWNRHANRRDPQRPLRVGFVSADLRNHPVARFLEPAWRELDRAAFELHAYDMQPADDPIARSLRALAARWTDVPAMSDAQLDARIRADGIDILFDLSGHTARNRLGVFARKPAPIQVSWIGYPGSTGLRAIDYRLVDAIAAPYGRLDDQFSERLAYLPYMSVFERPADLPEVAAAPQSAGAPLTFGSFNRVNKLGERTLALWARVLRDVPDARLLVGALPDEPRAQELRRRFAVHGIGSERLLLRQRVDLADYLALHAQVDILLDTLPFSSGTTANFALWMGVPTLTLAGDVLAQRLGAARMAAAGLPGFIAESDDEYVARAREWARRPQDLARLRGELRARMQDNAARQPAELAHALGARLREMWQRWCAGLEPERLA